MGEGGWGWWGRWGKGRFCGGIGKREKRGKDILFILKILHFVKRKTGNKLNNSVNCPMAILNELLFYVINNPSPNNFILDLSAHVTLNIPCLSIHFGSVLSFIHTHPPLFPPPNPTPKNDCHKNERVRHRSISPQNAIDLRIDSQPPQRVPEHHLRSHPRSSKLRLQPRPSQHTLSGDSISGELGGDAGPPEGVLRGDSGDGDFGGQAGSAQR